MRAGDLFQLGISNLWRTKLRTFLTVLGVTIGIGALISMVSFGTGMQKNITRTFKENDLFTTLYVTPAKIDFNRVISGDLGGAAGAREKKAPVLDDAMVDSLRALPGVEIAFPEVRIPVRVRCGGSETTTSLRALPASMGQYRPFNEMSYGSFFSSDTASAAIVSPRLLRNLNIILQESGRRFSRKTADTSGVRILPPDSILGMEISIFTKVIDIAAVARNPFSALFPSGNAPIKEAETRLPITAIAKKFTGMEGNNIDSGIIVPMKTGERIPHLGFTSVWSILGRTGESDGISSVYVRVKAMEDLAAVRERVETLGFGVLSIADQLEEIKKGFLIMDAALGTIGAIALIVAALGIINTMIMSILERRKEIGIMKAVGGSEGEIQSIFFFEAGAIGLFGGIFGFILGWIVTRIANIAANLYFADELQQHVEFFSFPIWLILGAITFSILVSLAAGLYPAIRAARVDPVEALRHE